MWSNMWSRKFYHIFRKLSTEAIAGFYGVTREYTTFGEVGPFWCSSSQSKRSTKLSHIRVWTIYHDVNGCALPVAVPCVRLADGAAALHTDRGHSLRSLALPLAALPSLPKQSHIRITIRIIHKVERKSNPKKQKPVILGNIRKNAYLLD